MRKQQPDITAMGLGPKKPNGLKRDTNDMKPRLVEIEPGCWAMVNPVGHGQPEGVKK